MLDIKVFFRSTFVNFVWMKRLNFEKEMSRTGADHLRIANRGHSGKRAPPRGKKIGSERLYSSV